MNNVVNNNRIDDVSMNDHELIEESNDKTNDSNDDSKHNYDKNDGTDNNDENLFLK